MCKRPPQFIPPKGHHMSKSTPGLRYRFLTQRAPFPAHGCRLMAGLQRSVFSPGPESRYYIVITNNHYAPKGLNSVTRVSTCKLSFHNQFSY